MDKRDKNILKFLVPVLFLVFLFSSCYKTDFDNISDELTLKPDVSFPIGETVLSLASVPDKDPPFRFSKQLYDTVQFSLSDIANSREVVDSVMFRINLENEFPAQCDIYVFYKSQDYDNSLTGKEPISIAPGKIDDAGKSTIPSKKQVDVWLDSTQVDILYTSDILIIEVRVLDMIVTQPVKDNATSYRFTTGLGLRAKLLYEK